MKCKNCQQEFTSERVWHTHRCPGRKPKRISPDCDADHCTPEERAVIEAAVRDREAETHPEGESRNVGFDRMVQARREFRQAVTQLLAARAGREKG